MHLRVVDAGVDEGEPLVLPCQALLAKAGVLSDPVALLSGVAMETFPCNCIWTQSHVIFAGVVVLTVGVVVNVGI